MPEVRPTQERESTTYSEAELEEAREYRRLVLGGTRHGWRIVKRLIEFDGGERTCFVVQEYKRCSCPDCTERHWFDWPGRWYSDLGEAKRLHNQADVVDGVST